MVTVALRRRASVCSSAILLSATMVGFTATLGMASGTTPVAEVATPLKASEATAALLGQSESERWRPHRIDLAPAKWIWLPAQRTLPSTFVLFRKEFDLSAEPTTARGWITADSRYELSVNGRRVQWGPAPCDPRHLDADPVDLKPFLKAGKNVIGVEVLFYGHGDGTWPGGQPGLIMNLEVQNAEGKSQIPTDNSWQVLLDRAHPPGQYKRWFLLLFRSSSMPGFILTVGIDRSSNWTSAGWCARFPVQRTNPRPAARIGIGAGTACSGWL